MKAFVDILLAIFHFVLNPYTNVAVYVVMWILVVDMIDNTSFVILWLSLVHINVIIDNLHKIRQKRKEGKIKK